MTINNGKHSEAKSTENLNGIPDFYQSLIK